MSPSGDLRTSGVVPHSSSWTASACEPQNRQMHPRCRRVTSRSEGYDCVNNATVREAGYDCRNNTAVLRRPEAVGWAPLVCAGPLTTSLRGLWVSGLLPLMDSAEGAATLTPPK